MINTSVNNESEMLLTYADRPICPTFLAAIRHESMKLLAPITGEVAAFDNIVMDVNMRMLGAYF